MTAQEWIDNSTLLWKPFCELKEAEKVIIGIPFGATQIGGPSNTHHAPNRLRNLFRTKFWTYDFERKEDLLNRKIYDLGNIKPAEKFDVLTKRIQEVVNWVLKQNPSAKIITIGGEHTVTFPVAKTLRPKTLLSLDAHPDFVDEYEGNKYSIACVMHRIHELGTKVSLRGIRTASEDEHDFLVKNKIDWRQDLNFSGDVDYLSIDIDVLDPIYVGTNAPETNGFKPIDVINLIRKINFKHCDIVEWNPDFGYPAVIRIFKELLLK